MTKLDTLLEPIAPTEADSELALDSSRRLATLAGPSPASGALAHPLRLTLQIGEHKKASERVDLPPSALPLLARLLAEMGQGHAVALFLVKTELSTQQAADLMNVSRPFLVGLLEQKQLPCRKVGKHRRVLLRDVLDYKRREDTRRLAVLEELAAQAQELDMGY